MKRKSRFKYEFYLDMDKTPHAATDRKGKIFKLFSRLSNHSKFGDKSGIRIIHKTSGMAIEVNALADLARVAELDVPTTNYFH